jgi:hypothetical protein
VRPVPASCVHGERQRQLRGAEPVAIALLVFVAAVGISALVGSPARLRWDGTAQFLWILIAVAIWVAALITVIRTPKARFAALGWDKYWVTFWVIALTLTVDGSFVPIGPTIWFMYWLARLRRVPRLQEITPSA